MHQQLAGLSTMRPHMAVVLCFLLFWGAGAETKKKKSILDYTEADVEKIFQEWEENDEDRDEEDDDPFDPRKPPPPVPIDIEGLQAGKVDPQQMMKMAKKNKPMMIFIGVKGQPDQAFTEKISGRWMQSLQNAHIPVQRYVVSPDRVMFFVQDGSKAWDIKDYMVTQTECTTVTFEQLSFPCAGSEDEVAEDMITPHPKTEL